MLAFKEFGPNPIVCNGTSSLVWTAQMKSTELMNSLGIDSWHTPIPIQFEVLFVCDKIIFIKDFYCI